MKLRTISLPDELDAQAFAAAQRDGRTYSNWARQVIERAVTGKNRLADLQDIATEGLRQYADAHGPRERANPGEIIAASSTAGHELLRAHNEIAKGAK